MNEQPKKANWTRHLFSPQAFVRMAALVALGPLLGLLGHFHWFLDLFNHLQAQYFVALLVITLVLVIWRKSKHAAFAAVALVIPALHLLPLYQRNDAKVNGSMKLCVASYNVLTSNKNYDEAVRWTLEADPDFIYLTECNPTWIRKLAALDEQFPHSIDETISGNFGFAFKAKHPILFHRIHRVGDLELTLLEAKVRTDHGVVTVFGCHPVPPVNDFWASERDLYLAELQRLSAATKGHCVILGDLNATRWSHHMKPILQTFTDTQEGFGYSATWMRENWLVAIPIDHILTRGFSHTLSRQTGPDLGSDHRPIVADLNW